ncbi:MAG: TPM domain-containing protein [Actinobacteria bacterium]|nr:TPM domain-containing protein [Actinomycetota bacterium]
MEKNNKGQDLYISDEQLKDEKPQPIADRTYFVFNDLNKGQVRQGSFVLRNLGGPYSKIEITVPDEPKFVEIIKSEPLSQNQSEKLPLCITFSAKALDWSRRYSNTIIARLDDADERVLIELDTRTKPVNDFAKIFSNPEIKKITALIERLEKATTAEIAVVTINTLEGKTIEKYAFDLFNEWGIGKENIDNGILFLIDPADRCYRIEIGRGLEKFFPEEFLNRLFTIYASKYFGENNFFKGTYLILSELFAEIFRADKNK